MIETFPEIGGPHFDGSLIGPDGRLCRLHKGGAEGMRNLTRGLEAADRTKQQGGSRKAQERALQAAMSGSAAPAYKPAPAPKPATPPPAQAAAIAEAPKDGKRRRSGALLTSPQYGGNRPMGGKASLLG